MDEIINGIQQIGIGVSDTRSVFNWYREHLGFDILLFQDEATASLMTQYTNDEPQRRDAYLSLNMRGGGGLEIWQFKDRSPNPPKNPVLLGDLGINAMKIRTVDLNVSYQKLQKLELSFLSKVISSNVEGSFFYFDDPWGNLVQVVQDSYSFMKTRLSTGGVLGAVIGVSDIDASITFYKNLLGYSTVLVDAIVELPSLKDFDKKETFRKVILQHKRDKIGGFG
ncbi:MAG: VOC family protein, partial [Maribacter sp.]